MPDTTRDNRQNNQGSNPAGHPIGPRSQEGVEANDLPNGGRGNVETDPGHELKRHVPNHTGEANESDLMHERGLAGHPDIRRADQENTLGRHQGDK